MLGELLYFDELFLVSETIEGPMVQKMEGRFLEQVFESKPSEQQSDGQWS